MLLLGLIAGTELRGFMIIATILDTNQGRKSEAKAKQEFRNRLVSFAVCLRVVFACGSSRGRLVLGVGLAREEGLEAIYGASSFCVR